METGQVEGEGNVLQELGTNFWEDPGAANA